MQKMPLLAAQLPLKGNCDGSLYLIDLGVYNTVFMFESHWLKI